MTTLKAVLLPTYRKNERYVDECVRLFDRLWPDHPEVWVISDAGRYLHPHSVVVASNDWVHRLAAGLHGIVDRGVLTREDYVLVAPDDHVCLDVVPSDSLEELAQFAVSRGIAMLSLSGHGRSDSKVAEVGGLPVFEVRRDFLYYSELHPSIWKTGHLMDVAAEALARDADNPWEFEFVRLPEVRHFTAMRADGGYVWPTLHGGFMSEGQVRMSVVRQMRHPATRRLKLLLIRDWILWSPQCLVRFSRRVRGFLARRARLLLGEPHRGD